MRDRRTSLSGEITEAGKQLLEINAQCEVAGEGLNAYNAIRSRRVSDKMLVGLKNVLSDAERIGVAWEKIKGMSDLSAKIQKTREDLVELEKNKTSLSSEVATLQKAKLETESSIKALQETAVKEMAKTKAKTVTEIENMASNAKDQVKKLANATKDDVEDVATLATDQMQSVADKAIKNMSGSAKGAAYLFNKSFEDFVLKSVKLSRGISDIDTMVSEKKKLIDADLTATSNKSFALRNDIINGIDQIATKAFTTGEEVGRHGALVPLLEFVKTGQGDKAKILPVVSILAYRLKIYAEGDPEILELAEPASKLYQEIARFGPLTDSFRSSLAPVLQRMDRSFQQYQNYRKKPMKF